MAQGGRMDTATTAAVDPDRTAGNRRNLADEEPPLMPSWIAANTDPSQYDLLGRRYYLNLSYRF
jgi:hypothetical protein